MKKMFKIPSNKSLLRSVLKTKNSKNEKTSFLNILVFLFVLFLFLKISCFVLTPNSEEKKELLADSISKEKNIEISEKNINKEIVVLKKEKKVNFTLKSKNKDNDKTFFFDYPINEDACKTEMKIIKNNSFVIGYCEDKLAPLWVAYKIFKVKEPIKLKRPSSFKTDKRTSSKVNHKDYTHSKYDRGHMAPNKAISVCYGKQAQKDTFLMSNIVPQKPSLNRGIWKKLESKIFDYSNKFEEIWIITGPIYDKDKTFLADVNDKVLKEKRIEIPDAFYKIVVDEIDGKYRSLSFVFYQNSNKSTTFKNGLTSIDIIEKQTNLNFFPNMSNGENFEAKSSVLLW